MEKIFFGIHSPICNSIIYALDEICNDIWYNVSLLFMLDWPKIIT